jgi:hypothetical protein
MGSVDTASRKYERLDFVALIFHVRTHLLENQSLRPINNSGNVFAHDPSGTNLPNSSKHLRPEIAGISRAFSITGDAERLARLREPSGKDNVLIPPEGSVSF